MRKITQEVARTVASKLEKLRMGSLDANLTLL